MVRPQRHYRVWPNAFRYWESLDNVPWLLTDVVDAMEALPESELSVTRVFRPPAVFHSVEGTVFGLRFRIQGIRAPGGTWMEVSDVRPA